MITNEELINSEEFENALNEGANYKKDMITSYKQQNKDNFNRFQEIMLNANEDIKKILETKKKNRTDDDNKQVEDFKKEIRSIYNQVQALTVDEHLEEGKKTKLEKIAEKIMPVLMALRYINNKKYDDVLNQYKINITIPKFEYFGKNLETEDTRKVVTEILNTATNIRQKIINDNSYINEDLYTKKVPMELQYDKGTNNAGLKTSDWRKLVDAKTKLIMANTDEAKEKAEEKIEHIASEKQFEAARATLVRDKLTKLN